jgi:hypothetical protein
VNAAPEEVPFDGRVVDPEFAQIQGNEPRPSTEPHRLIRRWLGDLPRAVPLPELGSQLQ